jgi:hypothetical protein
VFIVCTFDAARQHVVFINKLFEFEFEVTSVVFYFGFIGFLGIG